MGRYQYNAQMFIDAIPGSGGVISIVADRVGCVWNTAKKYIYGHPTVLRALENEQERVVDKAEHNIIKAINEGDLQTSKWLLTMKGANRGYMPVRASEDKLLVGGVIARGNLDAERTDQILREIFSRLPEERAEQIWRLLLDAERVVNALDRGEAKSGPVIEAEYSLG